MKRLNEAFSECHIILDLHAQDFPTIFQKVAEHLVDENFIPGELSD
jgi:hypothetical protein